MEFTRTRRQKYLDVAPEQLRKDVNDSYTSIEGHHARRWVAAHPNIPQDLLELLSSDDNFYVREGAAGNSKNPTWLLKKMMRQEDWLGLVYGIIITNPNATSDMIDTFINEPQYIMARGRAAYNNIVTEEQLEKLVMDPFDWVRECVAGSPKIPYRLMCKLADDESWKVRCNLLANPNITKDICDKLEMDGDEKVRKCIAKCMAAREDQLEKLMETEGVWIASNPNASDNQLKELLKKNNVHINRHIASNLGCSGDFLEMLSKMDNLDILVEVAVNPNLPMKRIVALSKHDNYNVRWMIAHNRSATQDILRSMEFDVNNQVREEVYEQMHKGE